MKNTPFKRERINVHMLVDEESVLVTTDGWVYTDTADVKLAAHRTIIPEEGGVYSIDKNSWTITEPTSGAFVVSHVKTREAAVRQASERIKSVGREKLMDALFKHRALAGDLEPQLHVGDDNES